MFIYFMNGPNPFLGKDLTPVNLKKSTWTVFKCILFNHLLQHHLLLLKVVGNFKDSFAYCPFWTRVHCLPSSSKACPRRV